MTGQKATTFEMRLERLVRAPRQRVFEAWTKPEHLRAGSRRRVCAFRTPRWTCASAGVFGRRWKRRTGAAFRWPLASISRSTRRRGSYITWSWLPEGTDDGVRDNETRITVELHEEGEATRVVMIHEGFTTAGERDEHADGWSSALNRLEALF